MRKSPRYSPGVRERLVHLVVEQRQEHPSQWATVVSVAGKAGMTPQTLLNWMKQHEPSAYILHAARQRDPSLRSARAKRDEPLIGQIQ